MSALADHMAAISREVDECFDRLLAIPDDPRERLYRAMRHATIEGGKRVRPFLLVTVADMHAVDRRTAMMVATAVEAIHSYSLIHDDLPCMDDDDLRRGKPTVHRAFDEAVAILAGDSLHALAFQIVSDPEIVPDPLVRAELVHALAVASGPAGMAGGQMMDLEAELSSFDLQTVTRLQQLKTGALISVSVEMAAILARIPADHRTGLRGFARDIGLAFQIADDILDAEGDEKLAGKALRKDEKAGKETFLTLLGLDRAREQADILARQAITHLGDYGSEADSLRELAHFVVKRKK